MIVAVFDAQEKKGSLKITYTVDSIDLGLFFLEKYFKMHLPTMLKYLHSSVLPCELLITL